MPGERNETNEWRELGPITPEVDLHVAPPPELFHSSLAVLARLAWGAGLA